MKAGGGATFDVLTAGAAKVAAVRLWIGTQDGKSSIKAKGEAEKDGLLAHVEVPSPILVGSMLWVEIESNKGEKSVVRFDLKL